MTALVLERTHLSALPQVADLSQAMIESLRKENARLRKELEELQALRTLAYRDPLTGLRNRRYFDERVQEELDRAERQGMHVSLLVVDVDQFKSINDTYGHLAGDDVLRSVADFLESSIRKHDVCCRTGGDEFTIILVGANEFASRIVVNRIQNRLARANATRELQVSLSIGAATRISGDTDAKALIASADAAMYAEKQSKHALKTSEGLSFSASAS